MHQLQTKSQYTTVDSRGPPVWNAIPCKIRGMQTFSRFKCLWKVHMTYDGLDTYMHIFINSILFHPLHRFLYPLNIRLDSVKHLCCASISFIFYFIFISFILRKIKFKRTRDCKMFFSATYLSFYLMENKHNMYNL